MSNFDNFIEMLNENGFHFTLTEDNKTGNKSIDLEPDGMYPYEKNKIVGYTGFVTEFEFDRTGKLIKIGIWE